MSSPYNENKRRWSKKYYKKNRAKIRAYNRQRLIPWRIRNKKRLAEYSRNWFLKKNYGITAEDYDNMLERQGGKCAICTKRPKKGGRRFPVDHAHDSKIVRGVLCSACNTLLGAAFESVETLKNAIIYLEKHNGRSFN